MGTYFERTNTYTEVVQVASTEMFLHENAFLNSEIAVSIFGTDAQPVAKYFHSKGYRVYTDTELIESQVIVNGLFDTLEKPKRDMLLLTLKGSAEEIFITVHHNMKWVSGDDWKHRGDGWGHWTGQFRKVWDAFDIHREFGSQAKILRVTAEFITFQLSL